MQVGVAASNNDLIFQVSLHDLHLVHSQCTGLVSADLVSIAHGLAALHAAHQVVLLLHLANGKGQADSYGKWQAFGDSDNDDCDAKDECVKHISDVLVVSQTALLLPEDIKHCAHANDNEDKDSDCKAALADLVCNCVKFVLEWGLLFFDVH